MLCLKTDLWKLWEASEKKNSADFFFFSKTEDVTVLFSSFLTHNIGTTFTNDKNTLKITRQNFFHLFLQMYCLQTNFKGVYATYCMCFHTWKKKRQIEKVQREFFLLMPLRAFDNFFHLYDVIMHKSFVVPCSENNLL